MKNIAKAAIVVSIVASALFVFVKIQSKPSTVAQFQTCVWPNHCAKEATIQPCVWPNTCGAITEVAQFQTCVWPNHCAKEATIQPCVWPNTCKS